MLIISWFYPEEEKKKEEARELKRLLEEACEEEKKGSERLLELEAREKGVVMEAEVEACRVRDLAKASEKKEEARRQSEELRGLEKALEACASERVRVESVLKQNGVKKAKLEKARSESVE